MIEDYMNKRVVPTCSPDHECSDEEINELLWEHDAIAEDESILTYEVPDVETMKEIIKTAEAYTGPWYHSQVVVEDHVSVSPEHDALRDRIIELGADHGISLLFQMSFETEGNALDPEAKARLAEFFGAKSVDDFRITLASNALDHFGEEETSPDRSDYFVSDIDEFELEKP